MFCGAQKLNIMNLENLSVQEMDAQELVGVDGGVLPLIVVGALIFDAFVLSTMAGYAYGELVTHNHD